MDPIETSGQPAPTPPAPAAHEPFRPIIRRVRLVETRRRHRFRAARRG